MGVSVYQPLSVLCVFVCVTSNQSTSKKSHYVSDLSKRVAFWNYGAKGGHVYIHIIIK